MHNPAKNNIAENFDRAAGSYDEAAPVQAQIASQLLQMAAQSLHEMPRHILDIGCGTGFAAEAAARQWPRTRITAIDGAPAMLNEARRKLPHLQATTGDIAALQLEPNFDLILSSMALHWLPDPRATLKQWQKGLRPKGGLFVALLVDGSFQEWRDLCVAEDACDGLWVLPQADFADDLAAEIKTQTITVDYPSARDFLLRLKATGAATPHPGHKPFGPSLMRRMLHSAPRPFAVTYRVLYIKLPSVEII